MSIPLFNTVRVLVRPLCILLVNKVQHVEQVIVHSTSQHVQEVGQIIEHSTSQQVQNIDQIIAHSTSQHGAGC